MSGSHILVLDLGSSGLRSFVAPMETPWDLRSGAALPYRLLRPRSAEALERRFPPPDLWDRVARVIREGLRTAGVGTQEIAAISVTSQRQGVAFLDGDGGTLYVGPNTDLRAVFEGATIDAEMADGVYRTTGHLPSLMFAPAKLRWWQHHHPRIFRRVRRVLTLGAWVTHRLTGIEADHPALLGEAGLLDVTTRQPATELLQALELDPSLLPPLVKGSGPVGALSATAADALGLPAGTPVFLAGPDTQAALLGMGATEPGQVGIVAGWSAPVQMVTEAPIFDAARRTWAGCHVVEGRWVVEANAGDTGGTLDMVRGMVRARGGPEAVDGLASRVRPGADRVTAFWGPHALDLASPGVGMGGLLAPTPITYNPVRSSHLARATLENIAYALRQCLERVGEVTGRGPASVALSGGMAQSRIFPQMLADVLGATVRLHHPAASAIGAAIAASTPASRDELATAATAQGARLEPDVYSTMEYAELYPRWLRLRERLTELSDDL